ncbi:MAG TPA: hypothetical protein VK735_39875 [Pseudonocardia sp.]|uniref:hypothetical protein n=1 Tax=Pseudonocardia sp. TaxID=60912 RepID=UPI002B7CF44C|nr:hypothetical protein [Pseudonocardia sp.]HTF53643.1 hypothetical protein [Pseudonocardia sp.]
MADNRLDEAIDTVARNALARAAEDVEWGMYDEIGENDWEAVKERMAEIAKGPETDVYWAAYDYLKNRAGVDDEPLSGASESIDMPDKVEP